MTKKEFENKIKELREQGFNIITYTKTFAEMEKGNNLVIIKR